MKRVIAISVLVALVIVGLIWLSTSQRTPEPTDVKTAPSKPLVKQTTIPAPYKGRNVISRVPWRRVR